MYFNCNMKRNGLENIPYMVRLNRNYILEVYFKNNRGI